MINGIIDSTKVKKYGIDKLTTLDSCPIFVKKKLKRYNAIDIKIAKIIFIKNALVSILLKIILLFFATDCPTMGVMPNVNPITITIPIKKIELANADAANSVVPT